MDLLKELRKTTNEYSFPEDGCTTYDKTYSTLKELELNILDDIHLENEILFPPDSYNNTEGQFFCVINSSIRGWLEADKKTLIVMYKILNI